MEYLIGTGLAPIIASAVGFRTNLWVIVVALAGHGLFDFVHGHVIDNPGVVDDVLSQL